MKYNYDEKKLKECEIDILDYFVSVCEENKLSYFLAYGTLLGAVRHKGFIPWDDDIDVYMKPQDYYRFKSIISKKNNKKYFYQSLETEKFYNLTFSKIRMNNTQAIELKNQKEKIHKGIYIDVFPLIPYPNKEEDRTRMLRNFKILNLLIEADLKDKSKYENYGMMGKILSIFFRIVPRKIRNFFSRNILKKNILYKGQYDNYFCIFDKKIFDKKIFDKCIKLQFEKRKYLCPKNYDKYLKTLYNDYMQLPKEEDRIKHSFVYVDFCDSEILK